MKKFLVLGLIVFTNLILNINSSYACDNNNKINTFIEYAQLVGNYNTYLNNPETTTQERIDFDQNLERITLATLALRDEIIACSNSETGASCEEALDELWRFTQTLDVSVGLYYQVLVQDSSPFLARIQILEFTNKKLKATLYCR